MKTIRWGIIGCGNVTEVKSGPGFQKAEHSRLVAVMRRDGAKAADYAQRHGVPKWYDDGDKLIADPEVDAVYVATPPDSHEAYALKAAAAGKPVYIEKPMARNHAECLRMVAACKDAGVPLFVAYYRRMLPRFLKLKELVANGAVGEPRFVRVTLYASPDKSELDRATLPWRVIPEIAGAGKFLDLASHTLDVLDYVLGPVTQAVGLADNQARLYDAEDVVSGSWTHANGAVGTGIWCFAAYVRPWEDKIEIVGSEGKLSMSTFGGDPVVLDRNGAQETFPLENPAHIQQPLIQTIVNELNGQGVCPSHGESAARTSWVMDQMLLGWRKGRPY
ncbi:MAG: Gfo/Idh/MocA family oxidoreductase [Planctomycetota bacterium]|nr:Gfo/Idh/MocA family oxidoreductase [Planctomycetota bacterium]